MAKGDYAGAEEHFRAALARREALAEEEPRELAMPSAISPPSRERRDYAKAKPLFERSPRAPRKHSGGESLATAVALNGLGLARHALGELKRPSPFWHAPCASSRPAGTLATATPLSNLALLAHARARESARGADDARLGHSPKGASARSPACLRPMFNVAGWRWRAERRIVRWPGQDALTQDR